MELCKDCKHFEPFSDDHSGSTAFRRPFGSCARWEISYGNPPLKLNECQVESDEGWGMIIGPEFGCVLWEAKMPLDIVTEPK